MNDTRIDIGGDHGISFVSYKEDSKSGLNVYHKTSDGKPCKGYISFTGSSWANEFLSHPNGPIPTWDVHSWDPLDISPSLLCRACGDHGFIKNGKWVKA